MGYQHGHSSRVSSARESQKQHECNRYDKTWPNSDCVALGDGAGCDPASAQPGNAFVLISFQPLPQPWIKAPSHTPSARAGRRDVFGGWRKEESSRIQLGCSQQAQPCSFPELFLPCPRRDPPVPGQRWGSAVPTARAGSGAWGAAEEGDGRRAQPDQGPLARVKLRDQQQSRGNVCCPGEPTSGSSERCPKRCRELGRALCSFCVRKTPQSSTWGWQRSCTAVLAVITQKRPSPA